MLSEYRIKTNIGVGLGIIAQIIGFYASYYIQIGIILWLAAIVIYGGFLVFIWGLWNYAKGKGYKGVWGLLGLLSILGLIILALFPDKKSRVDHHPGDQNKRTGFRRIFQGWEADNDNDPASDRDKR